MQPWLIGRTTLGWVYNSASLISYNNFNRTTPSTLTSSLRSSREIEMWKALYSWDMHSQVERRRSYCPGITISMRDIRRSSKLRQIKLRLCVLHGIRAYTMRSKVFDHPRHIFTRLTFLLCDGPSYFHTKRDFIF
ncbi:hypothetical protein HETIRDRAFT_421583 [Heterobasidion irregulare TC 32-1]|uniref:Uncharacterized protein n=1 Tax=Heterobasidion irregulare (strain TC 32-1) TaxID=747525 RepID=W4JX51_HETIT|nr:uncharacterized protein HETIRDRAFT_421583 [Heterobasidion irregulare TC 32-1]ETW77456.1 hypothetical protein HETIRDRAFT_421583 [Heterobasidion irregulare TC 32-1]